ncbi:MAG: hypothetical protein KKA07_05070 [Bacteroidetes bacterium]|nr:hypothetical protein [Bacteroidota bacterium]MBU1718424.1 hypothetical protein [Bacteroidota bacterium]
MKTRFVSLLTIFSFCAIVFSSCGGIKHKKEVALIDSLLTEVNKAKVKWDSIPSDTVEYYWSVFQTHLKLVEEDFIKPEKQEDLNTLATFGMFKKPLRNYVQKQANVNKEFEYTISQLTKLKADLENESVDEGSIPEFIRNEKEASIAIIVSSESLGGEAVWGIENMKKMIPVVDQILAKQSTLK